MPVQPMILNWDPSVMNDPGYRPDLAMKPTFPSLEGFLEMDAEVVVDRVQTYIDDLVDSKFKKKIGVPQGAPTSCSLATLVLRPLEERLCILAYADDTVTAFDSPDVNPELELESEFYGYKLKPSGSRWLKKNGK